MTLSHAILATIAYHDIFDYPLTSDQIHKFLIGKKASLKSIEAILKKLGSSRPTVILGSEATPESNLSTRSRDAADSGQALRLRSGQLKGSESSRTARMTKEHLFALASRQKLFSIRKSRHKFSKSKLPRAKLYSKLLSLIPTIKLVAISGALAMGNSNKNDDIDLVIITTKNTLWTTRFFANLILFPFKRKPHQLPATNYQLNNKACLNLFLDESNLKISPQNLYTAHEICQMKPLWDRNKTYSRFIGANSWVLKYLPNWQPSYPVIPAKAGIQKKSARPSTVEILLKKFQLVYMKSKISTERIGEHQLFFHPTNTQDWVLKQYKNRMKNLGKHEPSLF